MAFRRFTPLVSILLIAVPVIVRLPVVLAQQTARRVEKIEVEGLQRLTAAEVIATSGLRVGVPFSIDELDAAGQKLFDSGLFKNVAYRTTHKNDQVTIILKVEEIVGGDSPIVFDNFVWFSVDELTAAIKREVPSFAGTVADSGQMADDIKRALQKLLDEKNITGTVEYAPELMKNGQEHVFSVTGVPIPICALHFPGAKNISEEKLVKSSRQLTDADYSLRNSIAYSNFILFPLYRESGNLLAKFDKPNAKFNAPGTCKGVDLTIPVDEGPTFLWDKAEWSGNEAVSAKDLDEVLAMKSGELANGLKFDKRLDEVGRFYGNTGHLAVTLKPQPVFDNAASRVAYKISVKEGPQYRMGKLNVIGLSAADAKALEQKWKLKTGDIFDSSYTDKFFASDGRAEIQRITGATLAAGKPLPQIRSEIKADHQALTADVTITFKAQP
jgi:outer membrane protein insertion porin family